RLVLTRRDLFSGVFAPFLAPLAGDQNVSSGGFYSVVPIPFARHLRITTSLVPNWLQITWERLPAGVEIESFAPDADTRGAAATLAAAGADPKGIEPTAVDQAEIDVAANETQVVWQRDGSGTVLRLELFPPGDDEIPVGIRLQAFW